MEADLKMDHSDEDTNGSFEMVDKVSDFSETDSEGKLTEDKNDAESDEKSKEGEWEDVLGSGHLLKKIIKKGTDVRPDRREICELKYKCYCDDKLIEESESKKVPVSDSELIQGLDLLLPLMYVGEISEVKIGPRFAYGSRGLKENDIEIPPDATLHYTIELLSVEPDPEIETMSVETRKEIGLRKKSRGNWWYAREDYNSAKQCYKRALEYLDYTEQDDNEQGKTKTDADSLIDERINVYNNLAAAHLKTDSIDDTLQCVETVLKLKPNNVKALFRKGKALAAKGERKEAFKYYKKAIEIEPNDKQMLNEMQKLQNLIAADNITERKLYKKMFEPSKSSKASNRANTKNTWVTDE